MVNEIKKSIVFELKSEKVKGKYEAITFSDYCGENCSIIKSPHLIFEDNILFGLNSIPTSKNGMHVSVNEDIIPSMCLSREQVKELIPILQKFVDEGRII